jgi:hypothetical protein
MTWMAPLSDNGRFIVNSSPKRLKHHLARSVDVGDTVQLTLLVRGQVRSNDKTAAGSCLLSLTNVSFEVPSFEVEGSGADRTTRKTSRLARWSPDVDDLELVCELAATQRVEYLGLPKALRDSLQDLPVDELRKLLSDVVQQQKPSPPPPLNP